MEEKLIKTLQEQIADGAEIVNFIVVFKKNYRSYIVTCDDFNNITVDEVL